MPNKRMIIGAESSIVFKDDVIIKERIKKSYRIDEIDERIRKKRTKRELKVMEKLQGIVNVPKIISYDEYSITMERIRGEVLKDVLNKNNEKKYMNEVGRIIRRIHDVGIIHGDLTTSNFISSGGDVFIIDFGLSFFSKKTEDMAVDLHVLHEALLAKHGDIFHYVIETYNEDGKREDVVKRLDIVEKRGRNKRKNNKGRK